MAFDPRFTRWRALFIPQRFGRPRETFAIASDWTVNGYTSVEVVTGEAVSWLVDGYADALFTGVAPGAAVAEWDVNGCSTVFFLGESPLVFAWDAEGSTSVMWGSYAIDWRVDGMAFVNFGGNWWANGAASVQFAGVGSTPPAKVNVWKANGYTNVVFMARVIGGGAVPPQVPPVSSLLPNFAH